MVHEQPSGRLRVYVGTYTSAESEGIYLFDLDLATGNVTPPVRAGIGKHPAFLAIHPNRRWLFAVNETGDFEGKTTGAVSAYEIDDKTGLLTLLNQQPSEGAAPCHLSIDHSGKNVLVANYSGGTASVLPIGDCGHLKPATCVMRHEGTSVNPWRQEAAHAHFATADPANRFVMVTDLGIDKILVYRFDADAGSLTPHNPPFAMTSPGAGPRHIAFHPNGKIVYGNNELSSSITAYRYDAEAGTLSPGQTASSIPESFTESNSTAEIKVSPDGRFVYVSNRGHNSICIYAIDQADTLQLTHLGYCDTQGISPRNFCIDPTGAYLIAANQSSGNIVIFRIDTETGQLTATGQTIAVSEAVCIQIVEAPQRERD